MKRWVYFTTLEPEFITSPKLVAELMKRFRAMLPALELLNDPWLRSVCANPLEPR